jgi:hypothetical protein
VHGRLVLTLCEGVRRSQLHFSSSPSLTLNRLCSAACHALLAVAVADVPDRHA